MIAFMDSTKSNPASIITSEANYFPLNQTNSFLDHLNSVRFDVLRHFSELFSYYSSNPGGSFKVFPGVI